MGGREKERKGKERKGKERKGKERKGKEKKNHESSYNSDFWGTGEKKGASVVERRHDVERGDLERGRRGEVNRGGMVMKFVLTKKKN